MDAPEPVDGTADLREPTQGVGGQFLCFLRCEGSFDDRPSQLNVWKAEARHAVMETEGAAEIQNVDGRLPTEGRNGDRKERPVESGARGNGERMS